MKKKTIIEHLKEISDTHNYKRIKFVDGSISVDAWTANSMLCVHNAISEENKAKFEEKIKTKGGFIHMANFSYKNTKIKGE